MEHGGRLVSLTEWHQGGLRDLCSDLFGRRSTRALRVLMSGAFDRLGTPIGELCGVIHPEGADRLFLDFSGPVCLPCVA